VKRYFINQEGESNKFWNIDTDGAAYTVTFGKLGTNGRISRKELPDTATCETEAAKLIQEKLKKGYKEVAADEPIPAKPEANYRPMDEDLFWELIAAFNWKRTGDDDAVMRPAEKRLTAMSVEDIFAFDELLAQKLYLLDGQRYADACYPGPKTYIGGQSYISVDDFLYCRCGIVVNGREFFQRVLENPAEWPVDVEFESVLYLAQRAYERKSKGGDYPYTSSVSFETYSNKAGWNVG
jgi:predicted DNA-binding WGR domain protein